MNIATVKWCFLNKAPKCVYTGIQYTYVNIADTMKFT